MGNLLPPNATILERNITDTAASATSLNVDIKDLVTPNKAPSNFLSVLGWQNSVDRWNRNWSDQTKIAQIKASFDIHQKKGTVAALKTVAETFGYSLTVTEWWQEVPNNDPGTFQITLDTNGRELSENAYNTLVDLLTDAKPLTRDLKAIEINSVAVRGDTNLACGMYDGEEVTIYPKLQSFTPSVSARFVHYGDESTLIWPQLITSTPQISFRFAHYGQDDTTIFPKPI